MSSETPSAGCLVGYARVSTLEQDAALQRDALEATGCQRVFHVFGALAEFERDLIRERTMAGLEAARARGRTGGRPTVWTAEKLKAARDMYESREHDVATIARVVGVSRASVYRALCSPES